MKKIIKNIIVDNFENVDFSDLRFPFIVVYDNPSDCPNKFVARIFDIEKPTNVVAVKDTLEEIRDIIPQYMYCQPRFPCDDKVIVEVWHMVDKIIDTFEKDVEKLCINIKEAARLCGCCENTMRNMVHMKGFPKIKVGRRIIIPKQAFINWLNSVGERHEED